MLAKSTISYAVFPIFYWHDDLYNQRE